MKKFLIFVSFALLVLAGSSRLFAKEQATAYSGASYKIEDPQLLSQKNVPIVTDWDFYWGKFISPSDITTQPDLRVPVPGDWNKYSLPEQVKKIAKKGDGSGTYRLRLTNLKPDTEYAFSVFELCYTAFTVFADGKKIFDSGVPAEKWEDTKPEQAFDKAVFVSDSNGCCTLTFYVSNNFYRKGGFRGNFTLSENETYDTLFRGSIIKYSIFYGILILMILYCLLLGLQKKDISSFYLAVMIAGIFSRLIANIFPLIKVIIPTLPFTSLLRIEYLALFVIPSSQTLYFDSLNKKIFKLIPAKLLAAPALVFLILDFALPIRIVNRMVPFMQVYMFAVIIIDIILFFIRIIKDKDFVSLMAIIALLIITLGVTNDILIIHHSSILGEIKILSFTFILFAFFQIVVLAYIQDRNYRKVVEINKELIETNIAYYRFVPKEFLELLSKKDITEVSLGEYRVAKMAVLSADIRNFTATSEKLSPIQVFDMLNSYLRKVAPLIRKYNGVIEKYLGDGIIAIFPESAESALNCAIAMQEEMIELRKEFAQKNMPQIKIGIGIHYGDIVIGTGGDNERMTEISLSDDIDIAIKTEAATKLYKRPILVTKQTLNQAANELKARGLKFDFSGKEMPAQGDTKFPPLYSIYNNTIDDVL